MNIYLTRKKQILIKSGAAFIGSHLIERLLEEGCEIVCLDNFEGILIY